MSYIYDLKGVIDLRLDDIRGYKKYFGEYTELRYQKNRNSVIQLINGDISHNQENISQGISARVFTNGVWGFSSAPECDGENIKQVIMTATDNARFLDAKANRHIMPLPVVSGEAYHDFSTKQKAVSRSGRIGFLRELDEFIKKNFNRLSSRHMSLRTLDMEKAMITSDGSESYAMVPRTLLMVNFTMEREGETTEIYEMFGGFGEFEDNFALAGDWFEKLENLNKDLVDKAHGIYPESGEHEVILAPEMTGILAHESIGHTVEADIVQGGAATSLFMGKKIASDLVTLVDFANTAHGTLCPVPLFMDDEGTPAKDAVLIKKGVLTGMLHNKESAMRFDTEGAGNARASNYDDEPLIRMRNTAFLPGNDKISEMIKSVDHGYYLIRPSNGQADSTSEFMFGVVKGYEIKGGKISRALKDTTISGVGFQMLNSVTMVSDQMHWSCFGMCGKKQLIPVGMGGPAFKCKINIGGR